MGQMKYPAVVIDHAKLRENFRIIAADCAKEGVFIAGVIKGAGGLVSVAEDFAAAGAKIIASSRLEQLERVREAGIDLPLMLIRIPMLSEVPELISIADMSLNNEHEVLLELNKEAGKQNKRHKVILMQDLGDLREGWFDRQELIEEAVTVENEMDGLILAGIGTNLGCYGSVMPTEDKMKQLAETAVDIENRIGRQLEIVSGGATSSLMGIYDRYMPEKVNMLRIGAGILTGPLDDFRTTYGYTEIDRLHDDCFKLRAEVIELKRKPSRPIGTLGVDAFGNKPEYPDRGERMRAIVAVGRADHGGTEYIVPTLEGAEVIGASGDHTILDVENVTEPLKVGDIIEFKLIYAALLNLTGSENVKIYDI